MARRKRGRKRGHASSKWNISLTSAFMVLYTAIQFGLDQILISMLNGQFNLGSIINTIKSRINMTTFMNIMVVGIQMKLMSAIAKMLGGGQIGKFWKINLRW